MWWLLISLLPATAFALYGCGGDRKDVKPPQKNPSSQQKSSRSMRDSKRNSSKSECKSSKGRSSTSRTTKKSGRKGGKSGKSCKSRTESQKGNNICSTKSGRSSRSRRNSNLKSSIQHKPVSSSAESLSHSAPASKELVTTVPASQIVELRAEPQEMSFQNIGGLQTFKFINNSNERRAFKVKCSDNQLYRVAPVFGIVEPYGSVSIDVLRQNGSSKVDKLVVLTVRADAVGNKQPKDIIAAAPVGSCQMTVVPLLVDAYGLQ